MPFLSAVLELMGDPDNAENVYSHFLNTTEDSLLQQNDRRACILIWTKRKFTRILKDDMEGAVEVYELSLNHPFGPRMKYVKTMPFIMSVFLDGLIAFYSGRKNREEQKWSTIGVNSIKLMKKWTQLSRWNFENKVFPCFRLAMQYF